MLTINTNLSSLIAQSSMKTSTNKLNQAIERMTTGFKINHASDNAANYSISTNMTTKIGAYDVAEDNAAMGLDMISTAEGALDQIQDKLQRLRALQEQASNGTYGEQSLRAINAEANALVDEIERLYNTAEYNGDKLFYTKNTAGQTYSKEQLAEMPSISKAIDEGSLASGGTYSISSAEELAKLATIVNAGVNTTGMTFVLANDIDLRSWCEANSANGGWVPIGNEVNPFRGKFDGNGHVVRNIMIDRAGSDYQGVFGHIVKAEIYNFGVDGGTVIGKKYVGGLIGRAADRSVVTDCFSTIDVIGHDSWVGGLVASLYRNSSIINSYATGDVISYGDYAGGLTGGNDRSTSILSCYATGNIQGVSRVGGLSGLDETEAVVTNCFATGNVTGTGYYVGGLIGQHQGDTSIVTNCYALGDFIANKNYRGPLIGDGNASAIVNCARINSRGPFGELMTLEDLKEKYTNEFMGFTEENGWVEIGGRLLLSWQNEVLATNIKDLQVGINSEDSSKISCDTGFSLVGILDFRSIGQDLTTDYLSQIDEMLRLIAEKQTHFGAASNRLESVLEEITIKRDNLVSSRSTIRDADIAEVSSHYIQQQILQQASATLLATANQSPSIALQLI